MSRRCNRGGLEIWDMRLLEEEEYDCVIKGEKKIFRLICQAPADQRVLPAHIISSLKSKHMIRNQAPSSFLIARVIGYIIQDSYLKLGSQIPVAFYSAAGSPHALWMRLDSLSLQSFVLLNRRRDRLNAKCGISSCSLLPDKSVFF